MNYIRITTNDRTIVLGQEFATLTTKDAARYLAILGLIVTRRQAWVLQESVRIAARPYVHVVGR